MKWSWDIMSNPDLKKKKLKKKKSTEKKKGYMRALRGSYGLEIVIYLEFHNAVKRLTLLVKRKLIRYHGKGIYKVANLSVHGDLVDTLSELILISDIDWEFNSEFEEIFNKEKRKLMANRAKNGQLKYTEDRLMRKNLPMWDHQKTAARFIEATDFRCILRDGPRLGKCYSVLSPSIKEGLELCIVCPKEIVSVWEDEIARFKSFYEVKYTIHPIDNKNIPESFLSLEDKVLIIACSCNISDALAASVAYYFLLQYQGHISKY